MTDRWKEYFDAHGAFSEGWLATAIAHWGFHETLYGMISLNCPKPALILDVGSGPGWSDLYLSSIGYEVTGIDNNPELIDLARQQADRLGLHTKFEEGDAFDLSAYYDKFDLAYSCGVLEHFDRDVTVRLLKEQARCAKKVLIQIPTKYTAFTKDITDERIYSIGQLSDMVEDAGLQILSKFGYGDICATPLHIFIRRVMPRAAYRFAQNQGYAYSIAVIGVKL